MDALRYAQLPRTHAHAAAEVEETRPLRSRNRIAEGVAVTTQVGTLGYGSRGLELRVGHQRMVRSHEHRRALRLARQRVGRRKRVALQHHSRRGFKVWRENDGVDARG